MRRSGKPSDRRRQAAKPNSLKRAAIRLIVTERDDGACQLCGGDVDLMLPPEHPMSQVMDHVEEFSAGGRFVPENLRLAHRLCNEVWGRA